MKCTTAERLILLQDSGELAGKRSDALYTHLNECGECREYKISIMEAKSTAAAPMKEPDAPIVQNVLREARMMAPNRKIISLVTLRPALAIAASMVIVLGLFLSSFAPGRVGMEMDITETQLMESSDQMVDVMYSGLSEDDLVFNFLMTFEEG